MYYTYYLFFIYYCSLQAKFVILTLVVLSFLRENPSSSESYFDEKLVLLQEGRGEWTFFTEERFIAAGLWPTSAATLEGYSVLNLFFLFLPSLFFSSLRVRFFI